MEETAMTLNGNLGINPNAAWQQEINAFRAQCGCGKTQQSDINAEIGKLLVSAGDLFKNIGSLLEKLNSKPPASCHCAPVQPPKPECGCHPSGSLKVDNGVITTPGGYKIEQLNQFEWKVTDKCGNCTRVWGDPHVAESDGGHW